MKGAKEYATLFKTGQYGRLYITSGYHARGKTFHIQILPEGEKAIPNGSAQCLNKDAVVVYGVISGQCGWTEEYGWLHEGKWQEDFEKLYKLKKEEQRAISVQQELISLDAEKRRNKKIANLLENY